MRRLKRLPVSILPVSILTLSVMLLSMLLSQRSLAATENIPEQWERVFVTDGTIKLEAFVKGRGTTVIVHPSLGRPVQDFVDLGNQVVAAGYRVVGINPRGIGQSTGPMEQITLHELADDVWRVADYFDIKQTFLLGQNFGNRVSRVASTHSPDRVLGLILMAAGGNIAPSAEDWSTFQQVFDPNVPPEQHLQAVAKSYFASGNDATAWREGWYGDTARLQLQAIKNTSDFDDSYLGGTAPGLVIQGLNDRIAPPQNAFELVQKRPNTRLVALPNMGHAMLPEQPDVLADTVIDFLLSQSQTNHGLGMSSKP